MKTIKKVKIFLAIVCTLIAIGLCIAVCNEWKAQGVDMPFSLWAGCIVYVAFSVVLYIGGMELAKLIDYWFSNGDEYYKGGRK